jgi:ribonuclease-3
VTLYPNIKYRLFSKNRKEPYLLFKKLLGFYPKKIEYYQLAMLHRSVSIPIENGIDLSNERLEFLGDAIFNSIVTDILYHRYENKTEGFLTNTRSKIVKRESLNKLALDLGIDKLMNVSKNLNNNVTRTNLNGNALEALMGAIYLDYGYKKCKLFIEKRLLKHFIDIDNLILNEINFKSQLIEWCQKHHLKYQYTLLKDEIVNSNNHHFLTQLAIENKTISKGTGTNKKESEQNASQIALQQIKTNPSFINNLYSE